MERDRLVDHRRRDEARRAERRHQAVGPTRTMAGRRGRSARQSRHLVNELAQRQAPRHAAAAPSLRLSASRFSNAPQREVRSISSSSSGGATHFRFPAAFECAGLFASAAWASGAAAAAFSFGRVARSARRSRRPRRASSGCACSPPPRRRRRSSPPATCRGGRRAPLGRPSVAASAREATAPRARARRAAVHAGRRRRPPGRRRRRPTAAAAPRQRRGGGRLGSSASRVRFSPEMAAEVTLSPPRLPDDLVDGPAQAIRSARRSFESLRTRSSACTRSERSKRLGEHDREAAVSVSPATLRR